MFYGWGRDEPTVAVGVQAVENIPGSRFFAQLRRPRVVVVEGVHEIMPLYSLQRAQVRLSWSVRAREDRARAARGGGSVGARPWTGGCVPARTARGRSTATAAVACGTPKEDRGWAGQPGSRVRRHTHTLPLCGTGAGGHTSPVACRGRALQEWGAAHHHRSRARWAASRFWKRFPDLDPRVQGRLQQVSFLLSSTAFQNMAVACGCVHTVVVDADGRPWWWGMLIDDDSTISLLSSLQPAPAAVAGDEHDDHAQCSARHRVVMVAAGRGHCAMVTEDGRVLTLGVGTDGRLGSGTDAPSVEARCAAGLDAERAVMVACGHFHTAAVTASGKLYLWGFGGCGQLAVGDWTSRLRPTPVPARSLGGERVEFVACGLMQTAAVTSQVRARAAERALACPRRVAGAPRVACQHGWCRASDAHCLRVRQGNLYAWGGGEYGQLGLGDDKDRPHPCIVHFPSVLDPECRRPGSRIISACCGSYFTAAVTADGHLYTWGLGDDGQLGCENCTVRYLPGLVSGLPHPVCVAAAGDAHMACARCCVHGVCLLLAPRPTPCPHSFSP